ncbi:Calcium-transporting ATPase 12, plasma membrane-type [Camellia lanceoleosa]|uniref:Calcium-transporting ATPase 12, plasma membrane-type n=1 Tax=Camellia lanceoleosa TaxID=1840588 RepID=A0ACC0IC32_9ERIC|nr:Calcium-transporting ATPase 12, plasma membrane-type [Camellia lanceoleosa]
MNDPRSSDIAPDVLEFLKQCVALNTTGGIYVPLSASLPEISGSPTEKALLSRALFDLGMDIDQLKAKFQILHVEAFNSEKKRSGTFIRSRSNNTVQAHWKGAAEIILAMCSSYHERSGTSVTMHDEDRIQLEKIIKDMAAKSLQCIAFAHNIVTEDNVENHQRVEEKQTLLGFAWV